MLTSKELIIVVASTLLEESPNYRKYRRTRRSARCRQRLRPTRSRHLGLASLLDGRPGQCCPGRRGRIEWELGWGLLDHEDYSRAQWLRMGSMQPLLCGLHA